MSTLSVRLVGRKNQTGSWYEGTVSIAGLQSTKLARRSDGNTQFPTKSAVSSAARTLAKSLGFADVNMTDTTVKAVAPKIAAKKTATTTSKSSTKTQNKTTSQSQTKKS